MADAKTQAQLVESSILKKFRQQGTISLTEEDTIVIGPLAYPMHEISVTADPLLRDLQAALPPIQDLPENIQEFIESLEGLPPYEQMTLVHNWVNEHIKYQNQSGVNEPPRSPEHLLKGYNFLGDCDDHVAMAGHLLRYLGFPEENLVFLGGVFEYKGGFRETAPHVVLMVELDGQAYVLDMNMESPTLLNQNLEAKGKAAYDENLGRKGTELGFELTEVWLGYPFKDGDRGLFSLEVIQKLIKEQGLSTPNVNTTQQPPSQTVVAPGS